MLEIGLTCIVCLISLVSIGFSVPFQHLHPFQSYGFLDLFIPFLEKPLNSIFPIRFSLSKMASSQVEIASSAPFCILRDHNRRDQFTNTFQKSLKDYLLQTCISNSSPDENSLNSGSWVRNPDNNNNEFLSPNSKKHTRVLERWAKARDMVAYIDSPNCKQRENSPTQSDTFVEISNLGGVSSLVQRWRGFTETSLNQNRKSNNSHNAAALSPVFTSKSNSENVPPLNDTNQEGNTNLLGVLVQSNRSEAFDELVDERFDTPSMMTEDSFMDWESDRTVLSGSPSVQGGRDSTDGGESERVRVADVIRKLTSENQMQGCLVSWKNEQGSSVSSSFASPHQFEPSLPRLRTVVSDQIGEQRGCFSSPVVSSPRLRGRQAFNDLLMQLERDRHRELDRLVERRAVSKFSHRGRIQSLLRLRFLRREAEVRYDLHRQNLRQEAPIGAQQQHSHSGVVEGAQQHSHCEVAVEAPWHSHATEFRPQQISCHGGDTNDETNLCHEGVGAQQRFGGCEEATVGPQQHSHSEATVGNQQHSFSKEVRDLETAQGDAAVADRQQSHLTSSEASRTRQPSAVVLLREKFDIQVEKDASNPKTPLGVVVNNTKEMKNSFSSNQVMEEPQPHENLESCSMEDVHKEASPSSYALRQGIRDEVCNLDSKDYAAVSLTASNGWEEDVSAEEQETSNPKQTTNKDMINCDWQEQESDDQQLEGTDQDWISVVSRPWSEWDEQKANSQQIIETNNDWIMDISRPRSDWEGLREARYQEMLDPYLDNGDIRQLLERRSVSTFLSSNLKDTMDQLMISRAERLPQSIGNEQGEEDGFRNRLEQLMLSQTQRQAHTVSSHQEDEEQDIEENQEDEEQDMDEDQENEEEQDDEDDDKEEKEEEEDDDDDEESPLTRQYSEVGDYVDQVANGVRTWSHDGDHEISDDSAQVASQSSGQSQSSQASYPGTRLCSSFTNPSSITILNVQ
ncbi:uncharacterized protein LOC131315203 isoform X2 [Rhododendron vialii]|uniref:uncharacterized protein LOC131315203 isoform X2 n=1 Tax=Rhododendron vialii TaxID=182163 RepID=UPI00265E12AF|nr:uncharacterized protein LOC131315203 isoform X2 [Rhododendron vialii]